MNATAFDLATALKVLGSVMKQEGITHEQLRAQFPNRPTTEAECSAVATWLGEQIAKKAGVAKDSKPEWAKKAEDKKCPFCGEPKGQLQHACGLQKPSRPSAPQSWDDITDGNYALPYNGKTHFYRVSRREGQGKYAGRTFVNVQERASDELYRVPFKRGLAIMHNIREYGVKESHLLFSTELGQCWHCLKSLTDENNPYKVHGLGPVCGPKVMG